MEAGDGIGPLLLRFQGKNNIFYRVFKRTLSLLKRTPLLLFGVRFGVRFLICQN